MPSVAIDLSLMNTSSGIKGSKAFQDAPRAWQNLSDAKPPSVAKAGRPPVPRAVARPDDVLTAL
jgi:hypothetical protein